MIFAARCVRSRGAAVRAELSLAGTPVRGGFAAVASRPGFAAMPLDLVAVRLGLAAGRLELAAVRLEVRGTMQRGEAVVGRVAREQQRPEVVGAGGVVGVELDELAIRALRRVAIAEPPRAAAPESVVVGGDAGRASDHEPRGDRE